MRFADTSFWVALRYATDEHHQDAVQRWQAIDRPIVTTNHVVGETWSFCRRRLGHAVACQFLDAIQGSRRVTVQHVDDEMETEAWGWLRRHDERNYSFVDATSFAMMRRLRIAEALAYDADFAAAGFGNV